MSDVITSTKIENRFTVGMVLYPGMTFLDLVGPQTVLGIFGETLLLWKSLEPVATETGNTINPTTTFDNCPDELDVLFVPGGYGTNAAMQDEAIINFLSETGRSARYITSVCSGSVLLGMAGLLDGYKAATHWACYGALEASGAIPVRERVVVDRNRISGGGVTAGIDFGLKLLAELRDENTAKTAQLVVEYDPKPAFSAGTPSLAGPEIFDSAMKILGDMDAQMIATLQSRTI
ncbi:DJ-1/PfpI family protein [Pseudomonas sp. NFR09]|uniref:DJ-1/PfpI family protein n=1 Tax=Pseudomonas sp. NFR09 TaxID=1566249 RepID=UPI0008C750EB|nr:DJ-1/PfpI family protein [Pseudomonas sp. NFR09]SET64643.1 DJ-1/PfpI family protein [Pseudomonas sp. NFR09]